MMMAAQVSAAQNQAKLLIGDRLHRVNFQANRGSFSLDDARPEAIEKLLALGRSVARNGAHLDVVADRFLNGDHVAPFTPIIITRSENSG